MTWIMLFGSSSLIGTAAASLVLFIRPTSLGFVGLAAADCIVLIENQRGRYSRAVGHTQCYSAAADVGLEP